MPFESQVFPSARQINWPCAPQTNRVTSTSSVTSVCYYAVPADATVALGEAIKIDLWVPGPS